MKIKKIVLIVIIMFFMVNSAYADRITELQQKYKQLQIRIKDFKEMRLMTDLDFRVIIRNLQHNLQEVVGALKELQKLKKEEELKKLEKEKLEKEAKEKENENKVDNILKEEKGG